jgi:lipoate-protein ligase A
MAIDEALALSAGTSAFSPILRIYQWSRPAVTIGYNQQITQGIDLEFCRAKNIDIVRRPTGGRAVYHHQELTYAVVVPRSFFEVDTVLGSYRILAECFLECLRILGVCGELITPALSRKSRKQTERTPSDNRRKRFGQPACFLAPSKYEIGVEGKKIIGSAQRRYRSSILQQGSFLLGIDWKLFLGIFSTPEKKECDRQDLITCLKEILGREIDYEEVSQALIEGFKKTFGTPIMESDLTDQELDLAKRLAKEKYSSPQWNIDRIDPFVTRKSTPPINTYPL